MTRTLKVDLSWEAVTNIVTADLMDAYRSLKLDLENLVDAGRVFSHDYEEDVDEINRHLDALRTVLLYYGVDVDE